MTRLKVSEEVETKLASAPLSFQREEVMGYGVRVKTMDLATQVTGFARLLNCPGATC